METKTAFESMELREDGSVLFKIRKEVWNGDVLVFSQPHRGGIDALMDPDQQLQAVSAHLQQMGFPAMPPETTDLLKEFRTAMHGKPEVQTKIEETRAKRLKEQQEQGKAKTGAIR